jgi:hypothetical protein
VYRTVSADVRANKKALTDVIQDLDNVGGKVGSEGGTRTPDPRIMIPVL